MTEAIMFSTIELEAKQSCFEKWMTGQTATIPGKSAKIAREQAKGRENGTAPHRGFACRNWLGERQKAKEEGEKQMENRFIRAEDVAAELGVSKPYAYKIIRQLNEELRKKGFLTIAGRVNRQYFEERFYGKNREGCE